MNEEILSEIRSLASRRVREGFESFEDIVEGVTECVEDEHQGVQAREAVERAVVDAFDQHRAEQATWPVPTDCDRLNRAFGKLDASGVVARQNFSCCQNCGHGEIMDEVREMAKERPVRGYVFYHMQDTEHAASDGSLYLAYGAPDDQAALGWVVVEALRAEGLEVDWTGDVKKRILIKNLDWKRRRDFTG